ncbi:MAG: hypothetical protein JOZ90_06945 [Alphaproteobacteria bacterium]|nr:hypothetical protein [Alphaproteobacteria bacterium]MBV9370441.1 hypothetical protein [Alphaproteobacteria bacterium]MBV9900819.1 hypothetical protein [Alphaproteobacteria bacterium]
MTADLFDLIDGLFRGVVYFFYNLAETAYMAIAFPFRGPRYLYRLHKTADRRQMGSVTFVFLSIFLLYPLSLWLFGDIGDLVSKAGDALASYPSFGGRAWWSLIAASLTATTLFDAALRIVLRLGRAGRHARERTRSLVEYACFLPLAAMIPVEGALLVEWIGRSIFGGSLGHLYAVGALGLAGAALLAIPAGAHLAGEAACLPPPPAYVFPPPGPAASPGERLAARLRHHRATFATLLLVLLLAAATGAGGWVGIRLYSDYFYSGEALNVDLLRCTAQGQALSVDAVVRNDTGGPLLVEPGDFEASVGKIERNWLLGWIGGVENSAALQSLDPKAEPVLVKHGESERIRGRATLPSVPAEAAQCQLSAEAFKVWGRPAAVTIAPPAH